MDGDGAVHSSFAELTTHPPTQYVAQTPLHATRHDSAGSCTWLGIRVLGQTRSITVLEPEQTAWLWTSAAMAKLYKA